MTEFLVPGPAQTTHKFIVETRRPHFIVGRNGTGKSALVHWLRQQNPSNTVYLPGNRTALFDGESLSLTPESKRRLKLNIDHWDKQEESRWKNHSGNGRNEKAIHELTSAEQQYKNDLANVIANSSDQEKTAAAISQLQAKEAPLDRVNQILEQANISARLCIHSGELKATLGNNVFSHARMSDGERIALILIAEIIAAPSGAIFLIDEPELHLHRMIVTPLIGTLIRTRPDCEFIISTHELDLPTSIPDSRVCIMRGVVWNVHGQVSSWDCDIIDQADDLPEELVTDILGSRRRVLFIEGSSSSLDVPLYSVLFPKISIRSKGSCKEVQQAVLGIQSTTNLHHTAAFGLVDNDGMNQTVISSLEAENIYPLPCYSVESLYYAPEVLSSVAQRQASTYEADEQKQADFTKDLIEKAITAGLGEAAKSQIPQHLAGRLAERRVRDSVISQLPKRDELAVAEHGQIEISVESAYPAELAKFQSMLDKNDLHGIIARYPVRHSGILKAIAKSLKFQGRQDFESAALARIANDETLRSALLLKVGALSTSISA